MKEKEKKQMVFFSVMFMYVYKLSRTGCSQYNIQDIIDHIQNLGHFIHNFNPV